MTTTQTTEAPPLAGMDQHYGVWVTSLGDDGDLVAYGHHPLRTVAAAFNAYARTSMGLANLADDRTCTLDDISPAILQHWATRQTIADCAERAQDLRLEISHRCAMCSTIADGEWWIKLHPDQRPGSFPVTWMSA